MSDPTEELQECESEDNIVVDLTSKRRKLNRLRMADPTYEPETRPLDEGYKIKSKSRKIKIPRISWSDPIKKSITILQTGYN